MEILFLCCWQFHNFKCQPQIFASNQWFKFKPSHLCDHPGQEAAPAGHREVGADGEMTTSEPRQLAVLVRADIRVRAQLLVALVLHTEVRTEVRMLEVTT